MDFLLGLILGFCVGWIALKVVIYFKVKQILDSIDKEPIPKPETKTIKLNFTRTQDRIYAYDSTNDTFMAHGETKQEIIDSLNKRFPQVSFTANVNNMKEVGLE